MSRSLPLGEDLDRWLTPILGVLWRSTRRRWGPLFVRGLLGPDGSKSVQPIAARLGLRGHDQPYHFVSSAAWNDAPLWRVLASRRMVGGGPDAVLVIDVTGVPRRGRSRRAWRRSTVASWAAGQLPVAGLAHLGAPRGARACQSAAVSA